MARLTIQVMCAMPDRLSTIDVQLIDGPVRPIAIDPFPQECGAECLFIGRTRGEQHLTQGALRALQYEAHVGLARQVLGELADEAVVRFRAQAVRVHHAVGVVPVGEASVVVQVACGHRPESFDACRWLIDELKARAPIWKQEIWSRGGTTWVGGVAVRPDEFLNHHQKAKGLWT